MRLGRIIQASLIVLLLAGTGEAGERPVTTTECRVEYYHGTPMSTCDPLPMHPKLNPLLLDDNSNSCYQRMREAMTAMNALIERGKTDKYGTEIAITDGFIGKQWDAVMRECVR